MRVKPRAELSIFAVKATRDIHVKAGTWIVVDETTNAIAVLSDEVFSKRYVPNHPLATEFAPPWSGPRPAAIDESTPKTKRKLNVVARGNVGGVGSQLLRALVYIASYQKQNDGKGYKSASEVLILLPKGPDRLQFSGRVTEAKYRGLVEQVDGRWQLSDKGTMLVVEYAEAAFAINGQKPPEY